MAPTIVEDSSLQEKKKSGIRRLLSPAAMFVGSENGSKRKDSASPVIRRKLSGKESRTSVETAFLGNDSSPAKSVSRYRSSDVKLNRRNRSKSLSPVRPKTGSAHDPKGRKAQHRDAGIVTDKDTASSHYQCCKNDANNNNNINNEKQIANGRDANPSKRCRDGCKIPRANSNEPPAARAAAATWSPYPCRTEAVAKQNREKVRRAEQENRAKNGTAGNVAQLNGAAHDDQCSSISSSPTLIPSDDQTTARSGTDRSYETSMSSSCESMPSSYASSSSASKLVRAAAVPPYSQYYNKTVAGRDGSLFAARNGSSGNGSVGSATVQLANGSAVLTKVHGLRLVRPHPIYNGDLLPERDATGPQQRPRSVSPTSALKRDDHYFVRGSNVRSTIGAYSLGRHHQSTIYEHAPSQLPVRRKLLENNGSKMPAMAGSANGSPVAKKSATGAYPPIFKRGALLASSSAVDESVYSNGSTPTSAKRVSFSPSREHPADPGQIYWPTRKGMAPEPPTRQSSKLIAKANGGMCENPPVYVNVHNSPERLAASPTRSSPESACDRLKKRKPSLQHSESESGSEAGEVQKIFQNSKQTARAVVTLPEEEWNGSNDAKNRGPTSSEQVAGSANRQDDEHKKGGRSNRRDDPRRHTLSGDHTLSNAQYRPVNSGSRSVDLEMPSSRGYPIPSNSLFDDDPGIMSEVETSSTGFRRGNKQRSSLPVVRTPSKTLERPLGLVFLQYRNETKKSLLPNEITSLDTVKALFVRSFPKQLTMDYLDTPGIKIYIHEPQKNMFYELEDSRLHLNEIRGGSILRLYDYTHGPLPPNFTSHPGIWDQDQSYFSEPEFDSEYEHQHIHKSKINKSGAAHQSYYMTHSFPPGSSATLPRGGPLLRPYSPAIAHATASKQHPGFMSSPERAVAPPRGYNPYRLYEDPYYAQFAARSNSITPIIDEETNEAELLDESFNLYGASVKLPVASPRGNPYNIAAAAPAAIAPTFDATRLRVEHMERQLANLTGLVQKALTHTPTSSPREREFSVSSDKSVSFEKSVSFSDDPPDMNCPKQHSPQSLADTKPTKPAIKSSTLPRTSSQERERLKPVPPPKPLNLSTVTYDGRTVYRDLQLTPEMYNQLRGLQKRAKDLRQELRNLRRISQAQTHTIRETIKDTFIKIRSVIVSGGENLWCGTANSEKIRVQREEELYKQEMIRLETDLTELETTVEELRGNVINRKTRVNMSDVENMALILSKSSKTVADLKLKFPNLQSDLKMLIGQDLDRVVVLEAFLKEEPDKLETALKRCKKLTGTLVTLKRLASVQEQRLPDSRLSPTTDETPPITPTSGKTDGSRVVVGQSNVGSNASLGSGGGNDANSAENALDSLLEELKTFSKLPVPGQHGTGTLRRLNSYPSSTEKPPVPERNSELTNKRVPPPPPPRTSSKSPLASPTNVSAPVRSLSLSSPTRKSSLSAIPKLLKDKIDTSTASSSSCESINSQEGIQNPQSRQEQLEIRHQELLRKQKALQEQYTRLQQLQRIPAPDLLQLKKTGSESNLIGKLGLGFAAANSVNTISGSLSQLAAGTATKSDESSNAVGPTTTVLSSTGAVPGAAPPALVNDNSVNSTATNQSNNKVYETDIL